MKNPTTTRALPALAVLASLFLTPFASHAIILYGKDNDANQTDPGNGAPWTHVGQMTNSAGTAITTGSAVYLGHGFILTANHVDPNANRTHITFDGNQFFAIDQTSHQQVAAGVDLKVVRLAEDPGLAPLLLYEDAVAGGDLAENTVQVGWGLGRDPSVPVNTSVVEWGSSSSITKRWGTNTTLLAPATAIYSAFGVSYNYVALQTQLSTLAGPDEAAMTQFDSGGALFQEIDGVWYLSGIATAVQQESVNGQQVSRFHAANGHLNFFARIATYSDDIHAVIPEPSAWGLFFATAIFGAVLIVRSRRRQS